MSRASRTESALHKPASATEPTFTIPTGAAAAAGTPG